MSTNQNLKNRKTESGTSTQVGDKQPKAKALDLSVPQILGGALAAMTAAALGAQLSVAGTLVGAALASIIAAVAGSLYTASIRRTRDKVKTVFWTGQPNEVEEPTVIDIVADTEGHITGQRSHLVEPEPSRAPSPPRRPKLNWKRVAVAALAAFGIAAVALTTFELVTGHALSGGEGTTIQQVREGNASNQSDTKKKEPSKKATKEATATPSETPIREPSAASQPSEAPTSQPQTTSEAPTTQATTEAPEPSASSSP
jgi:outer membrane lipoprotein SlyB